MTGTDGRAGVLPLRSFALPPQAGQGPRTRAGPSAPGQLSDLRAEDLDALAALRHALSQHVLRHESARLLAAGLGPRKDLWGGGPGVF